MIEAFSLLDETYDEYKLVIAGKITDYKNELDEIIRREKLENRVIFTGFVEEEDKISIYQDAELFVNPVKYMGGVSITVFESILSGTPVIATPESGELVSKIDAGTVIEYGDINALRDEIVRSLSDKELTDKQLSNGQKYIRKNLDWETVSRKILKVYTDAVEEVK